MRIALVCPYSLDVPGGVGTHVLGLAGWLADEGHEPLVVAPGTHPVEGDFEVELLGTSRGFAFNGSTANLAVAPTQARRALQRVAGADVLHVHEPLTPGIAYAAATAGVAGRLVVTHHASFAAPAPLRWVLRRRARGLGERASIAVSESAAATALAVTGVRPTVVPNAITMPASPSREPSDRPLVLFVGRRDEPRKGYSVFEEAARSLGDRYRFVAVGPGKHGRAPVELVGAVPAPELSRWLGRADVVVAPNLGGESFGMVLVEALAHGCGLAASDLAAFRAVVDSPGVVTWFEPGDAAGAALAIQRQVARGTDVAAARRIAAGYTWEAIGPRVVREYTLGASG